MFQYRFDPDSGLPIYRQLADQIRAQIHSGALKTGAQLPTVREMAEKLHLSCGTVKHVYDSLQKTGDIEMTRRRGTFVTYVRRDQESRKQQAMNAIDRMIRKLSELNFSPAEIQIFLNLKMREWGLKWSGIRIAVVTEYPEMGGLLEKQLGQLGNVQVIVCTPGQFREYPYQVDEQSDVILASVQDSQKLALLLPDSSKLIRVAFQPDAASVAALACAAEGRVGVLCENAPFAALVSSYLPAGHGQASALPVQEEQALDQADMLVAASEYETVCSTEHRQLLSACSAPVLRFAYRLDEGSMLYLQERITRIRDERQHWPGALRI